MRNLTFDCTPEDLKELFGTVGEVVEADIITSKGHHRGMGTVEFTKTNLSKMPYRNLMVPSLWTGN